MTTNEITAKHTDWLRARGLEIRTDDFGNLTEVRPVGANVWRKGFRRIGIHVQGGKEVFDVQSCYVCPSFGMPAPAARVESSHSTLRSALRALLAA